MSSNRPIYAEAAPSRMKADEPVASRVAGATGWCAVVFGAVVALTNIYMKDARLIPEWLGWIFIIIGLVGVFVHAAAENDQLIRQALGIAGAAGIVIGIALASGLVKFWSAGLIPFVPGIMLVALFARREEDHALHDYVLWAIGGLAILMSIVGVGGMFFYPAWIAGPGSVLTVLGLITLIVFLALTDFQSGVARWVAIGMTAFGGVVFAGALLRSTVLFVLHDWRSPTPDYAVPAAVLGIAALLLGLAGRFPIKPTNAEEAATVRSWSNIGIMVGLILATIGVLRYVSSGILRNAGIMEHIPEPYLVPKGLIQMFAGLIFVIGSISFWSENRLVVMTRREFTSFFASPIAYVVMIGFTCIGVFAFAIFLLQLFFSSQPGEVTIEEPIVASYFIALFPVLAVMVAVPLMTMRLFSEERRTGTLEVMLTAPVSEGLALASKYIATLMLFMLLWLPWLLFLLALRLESAQAFDFRPVLGFVLVLFVSGASFIAMGVFFSSLTQNQIVASALTFAGMMLMIGFYFFGFILNMGFLSFLDIRSDKTFDMIRTIIKTMSFVDMWSEAIKGKIMLKDIAFHFSAAVMWLLATYKVLEARRWS